MSEIDGRKRRRGRKAVHMRAAVTTGVEPASQLTIDEAFDIFYQAKAAEGLRERTLHDYKTHHRYFMSWLKEAHPEIEMIGDITPQILREYVYFLTHDKPKWEGHPTLTEKSKTERGLSPHSVNIRLATMKAFYRWLHNEGYIPSNPAANIKKQPVEEDKIGAFTDEQVEALLAQPDQRTYAGFRDYVLMRLLLETGLRINEALSLTAADIDVKMRMITLEGSRTKNRKTRVIPLSSDLIRLLLDLIAENKTYFPDAEHIFLSNMGDPISQSNITDRIKEYGVKAGIADQVRVSPHTFRHTFALNFLMAGGDIIALQRILGHSSMEMVRKYVQHTPDDLMTQYEKFVMAKRVRRPRKR